MKNNRYGMTLIEVILAMAIFVIVATGFLSMFSSSLIWIYAAGDKGEAYSLAQQDVERRLITEDASEMDNLELVFGDTTISVRGGLVESEQNVNMGDSTIGTFAPYIPTISLKPMVINEGEKNPLITIEGKYTNFDINNSKVEILDIAGNKISGISDISPIDVRPGEEDSFSQIMEFNLPINSEGSVELLNNRYIIRVATTNVEDVGTELARSKFFVEQPRFIIAGEDNVFISADGIEWTDKKILGGSYPSFKVNDIANSGYSYMAVGENGNYSFTKNYFGWTITSVGTGDRLTGVTWSRELGSFFAVGTRSNDFGETGVIYKITSDGNANQVATTIKPLHAITSVTYLDGTHGLTAVGEGTIASSSDGSNWNEDTKEGFNFTSISSGNELIVATFYKENIYEANEGISTIESGIFAKTKAGSWGQVGDLLKDIEYRDITYSLQNRFIVVGTGITVIYDDGINLYYDGINLNLAEISGVENKLFVGVFSEGTNILVVREDGLVLRSTNLGDGFPDSAAIEGIQPVRTIGGR